MREPAKKRIPRQEINDEVVQLPLSIRLRHNLHEFVIATGLDALTELLEQERVTACGPRHARDPERTAYRAGHAPGELVMGGRRVGVRRPRARTTDNQEVMLPSWTQFSAEDPLGERAVEQMVLGVSTRKYGRSLEEGPAHVKTRGTSKSAVSRRFVAATAAKLKTWLTRDLSEFDLVTLMIDGVHIADHVVLVALGIDVRGEKRVLGLWEGATENATACNALIANLRDRGLHVDRSVLVVIDGSKALGKAIRKFFGERACLQRCRVHKKRNVREHLPQEMHASVMAAMSTAYSSPDAERAHRLLENLANRLEVEHPSAAASLREGLEETLTVKKLGLTGHLERILSCTNAIENLIGTGRRISHRVKRWRGGQMILRWTATAMIEAEANFRKIQGCKEMPVLVTALRRNDERIDGIDSATHVA